MSLIDWTDELSVHIAEIDSQHKVLIGLINDLHDAMRVGEGRAALERILADLVTYTTTHFAYEESLMAEHGFAELETHRSAHTEFAAKVTGLQRQYHEGTLVMTVEVMHLLIQWLKVHIQGTDKRYAPFFNGKGIL